MRGQRVEATSAAKALHRIARGNPGNVGKEKRDRTEKQRVAVGRADEASLNGTAVAEVGNPGRKPRRISGRARPARWQVRLRPPQLIQLEKQFRFAPKARLDLNRYPELPDFSR
jgi:hypothetical protein